jgi:hypothetical protein
MKHHYRLTSIAGLGALASALLVAGCGGNVTPSGSTSGSPGLPVGQSLVQSGADSSGFMSPDKRRRHRHHHQGYCAAIEIAQNFNGQAIAKGSWILFTSATQFPGNQGAARVEMKDSRIRFSDGLHNYTVNGPDMAFTYDKNLRLRFNDGFKGKNPFAGGWTMSAPTNTGGNDFLDDMVYRVPHALPGNIQNVTWSAKFYSRSDIQQMHWQWGAAVYTRLSKNYSKLGIKALDDNHYPPYNSDSAGTPERYKGFVTQGATGGGGGNYTGMGGPTQNVTPCY